MNTRLIIASDLDGTLADHTRMKLHFAKEFGYALAKEEATSDIMKTKIPFEDYKKITSLIYRTGSLHASVMPHAKEAIQELIEMFGPLYVISRRGKGIEADYAIKWLHAHLIPPLRRENIFFVEGDIDKQTVARKLGVTLYIDDKQDVLDQMPEVAHRILFDPHNNFPESTYPRLHSWGELPDILEQIP